ncbi:hypothetical protein QWZ10_22175 [Paracoccus cavernae]|uniref:Uncharacterized protein n=1 Tax=Paracoccus cavernae TaxID=1571207 RepID=A0ABT8DF92_9RHOB|nr:hypothetical protein [Paracoccus cavernae]
MHTHRHPMDVARSLQRWWDYDPEYSQILWLRHVLDAEADSRGMARVFTNFDEVLDDWRVTVGKISDGLGFDWPRDLQEAAPELDDFLTGELRHFSTPRQSLCPIGSRRFTPCSSAGSLRASRRLIMRCLMRLTKKSVRRRPMSRAWQRMHRACSRQESSPVRPMRIWQPSVTGWSKALVI